MTWWKTLAGILVALQVAAGPMSVAIRHAAAPPKDACVLAGMTACCCPEICRANQPGACATTSGPSLRSCLSPTTGVVSPANPWSLPPAVSRLTIAVEADLTAAARPGRPVPAVARAPFHPPPTIS